MTEPSTTGPIETHAVIWGTFSAAIFTVPVAIAVGLLDRGDNDLGGIATILKIVLFVSPLFAGFAAGRTATDRQVTNGALAGSVTLVLVQIVFQVAKGQFSNPLVLIYVLLLGASLGCFGGMLAARWAKADEPRRPLDDDEPELDAFDFSDIEPHDDPDTDTDTNNGSQR